MVPSVWYSKETEGMRIFGPCKSASYVPLEKLSGNQGVKTIINVYTLNVYKMIGSNST